MQILKLPFMKKMILLAAMAVFLYSCNSVTGNGNVTREQRSLAPVNAIHTSGSIDLVIVPGKEYAVTVENDDNLLPYVITEVRGDVLDIHYKEGTSVMRDHALVTVSVPSISKISSSGSADIKTRGVLSSDREMVLTTSGSGDIEAEVDAPSVKVTGSGSGDISLSGRTKDFECRVSGSGDIECANLKSENVTIQVSGSSDAHVFASVSLKATITGSGDIYYAGHPSSPEIRISGSGSVKAVD